MHFLYKRKCDLGRISILSKFFSILFVEFQTLIITSLLKFNPFDVCTLHLYSQKNVLFQYFLRFQIIIIID